MSRERFKKLVAEKGVDTALGSPVEETEIDPIIDMLSNEDDAKRDREDTAALAALTFGDLLYDVVSVDPLVIEAADFSRTEDLADIFSFSFFADGVRDMSDTAEAGASAGLKGYVAEQVVAMRLVEQGHQVSLPEHANEPGIDLFVDGYPFQVKCLASLGGVHKHFAQYPDVPVIANGELADAIGNSNAEWVDKVFFIDGYSHDYIQNLTDDSLDAGAEILDFEIPMFVAIISGARGLHGWWRGDLGLPDALADVAANVATKGTLGVVGGVAGKAAGVMIFGPAGGVVFGGVVAVAAASQSRRILDQFKSAAAVARDAGLSQATGDLLACTSAGLNVKLSILDDKRSKVGGSDPVSSYLRGRFEDDIAYYRERANEVGTLAASTPDHIVDHALRAVDAVRRSKVHPVGLQSVYKKLLEAFEELQAASKKWF